MRGSPCDLHRRTSICIGVSGSHSRTNHTDAMIALRFESVRRVGISNRDCRQTHVTRLTYWHALHCPVTRVHNWDLRVKLTIIFLAEEIKPPVNHKTQSTKLFWYTQRPDKEHNDKLSILVQ